MPVCAVEGLVVKNYQTGDRVYGVKVNKFNWPILRGFGIPKDLIGSGIPISDVTVYLCQDHYNDVLARTPQTR